MTGLEKRVARLFANEGKLFVAAFDHPQIYGIMKGLENTPDLVQSLKDTELDGLYYANYKGWTETAAGDCKVLAPLLSAVSDSFITGYEQEGDTITTEFSNGTVVTVDMEAMTVSYNGSVIELGRNKEKGES